MVHFRFQFKSSAENLKFKSFSKVIVTNVWWAQPKVLWAPLFTWCRVVTGSGWVAEKTSARRLLQLSVFSTTPKNSYLWLHSGGGACVPVVGVCCIMGLQNEARERNWDFVLMAPGVSVQKNSVHSRIPLLNYVTAERSRGRGGGGPEVSQRLKWERRATPERRTLSSSSFNHHHPSPFPSIPHPGNSSVTRASISSTKWSLRSLF